MQRDPKWSPVLGVYIHCTHAAFVVCPVHTHRTRLLSFEDQDCILRVSNLVWVKKKVRQKESGGTLDHFVLFLKLGNANFPIKWCPIDCLDVRR